MLAGLVLAAALVHDATAAAPACRTGPSPDRPAVGLVLGGGGARGYAHIGALKLLEEMRIPVDYVAGTSMGSIVGAFTATGMTADEILGVVETMEWDEMFQDEAEREDKPLRRKDDDRLGLFGPKLGVGRDSSVLPGGVLAGQRILFKFENLTSQRVQSEDFDRLPIPFRAVATDIVTGEAVVLDRGSLSNAMRASMAVPGVFDPVRRDGRLLVDGGLSLNLPVDVVRAMGADVVIAIDVGTPLMGSDDIRDVLSIIEQLTGLMVVQNTRQQIESLGDGDVLIRPRLGTDITSSDFEAFTRAIPLGYEAAQEQRAALAPLALDGPSYAAWRSGLESCESGPPEMQFVELENHSRFSDDVLWPLIDVEPGDRLDLEQVENSIRRIYGLGFIRLAQYRVVEKDGRQGIVIEVQQDARGTDYLETGLTITGGRRGTRVDLQAGYLVTDLDERGSEFRAAARVGDDFGLLADAYKYLDDRRRWVLSPEASISRRGLFLFDDGGFAVGESEIDEADLRLRFGREFGNRAIAWLGVARYFGSVSPLVGLNFPSVDFDGGEWLAGLAYDNLDNLFLPGDGALANLRYVHSTESLGADQDFEQVLFSGLLARSWGRHSALASLRYNTTLDDDAPVYAVFTGGGFLNMSGFEPFELSGQHFGVAGLGYRYQVAQSGILPGYVGGTLEYGNAAHDRDDVFGEGIWNGSVYLAYDTPIGPLYLGWGWNEDRSGLLFLQLGAILGSEAIGRR